MGYFFFISTSIKQVKGLELILIPLFHQGSSSAGSEPELKPVLCFSTPKAPAPNQEKRFVSSTKTLLGAGLPWPTRRQKLRTAIFEIAAKYEHVGFAVFGCRCRFAKPWTSIATQRPPLLIVCLGLFGMDWCCADRSVHGIGVLRSDWKADVSLCFWIALAVL